MAKDGPGMFDAIQPSWLRITFTSRGAQITSILDHNQNPLRASKNHYNFSERRTSIPPYTSLTPHFQYGLRGPRKIVLRRTLSLYVASSQKNLHLSFPFLSCLAFRARFQYFNCQIRPVTFSSTLYKWQKRGWIIRLKSRFWALRTFFSPFGLKIIQG